VGVEIDMAQEEEEVGDGVVILKKHARNYEEGGMVNPPVVMKTLTMSKQRYVPIYRSVSEDKAWATSRMVAMLVTGESILSIQHRVEDARFVNVVVTSLGGDRVFLSCLNHADIWKVFNDAIDIFGMFF